MTNNATDTRRSVSGEIGRGDAVVLGAGIAGILAARVLADSYDRVTILDRDVLPGAEQRRGAAQGRHLHGLTERGRQIMEELFPGLATELAGLGAPTSEVLVNGRVYFGGLRARSTPTGFMVPLASRPLLESVMRARTAALPGVRIRQRTAAVGLVTATVDPNRIAGVRVVPTNGILTDGAPSAAREPDDAEVIVADLVVDATGRGSRAPQWLAQLGHARPSQETVDIDLGESSRTYRRRPEHLDGDVGVLVSRPPGGYRAGGAVLVEGDRWHVSLGGILGDHPPTDHEGFEAFAASLAAPDIHQIITDAEPLDDPVPYRFRSSLRRHYEGLRTPPEGFLAIGDAVCSFNPAYGQGMTMAAQQAEVLRDCLRSDEPALPRRFYRRAARPIDAAWQMSTTADLNHPGIQGRRTLRTRLVNAYVYRVHVAAHVDPTVARTFMRVANLVEPPKTLLRPTMMARVLRRNVGIR